MLAKAAFPSFFLTLAAFVLLLLVTLSVPIIKTIYLLHIEAGVSSRLASGSTAANLGVFGTCYQGSSASFLGITYCNNAACTKPAVGYTLDPTFFGENLSSGIQTAVVKGVAGALILNPIACGLAGISLVLSFCAWFCASRIFEILCFLTLFLSSLAAWVAFWLDLALVLVARSRIKDYTNGAFTGHIGNALWLGLAAAVTLSVSICFTGCGVFGRYSSSRDRSYNTTPVVNEKPRRFWQRRTAYRGTY